MSFGFGVGDFLTVFGLVTQLRKDFADAPSQIRDLSAELKTFSIVLLDTEVDLATTELDSKRHQALNSALSGARDFLQDLEEFVGKNKELSTAKGTKNRVKRVWKRLNFDQQEVDKLRLQINSITLGLQALTANEVKHNTRKIARYVDDQVQRDALKWLSDDDFKYHKNTQSHLVRNRQAGTRKWLLESVEWKTWLSSQGCTLYCPGIPGSGKTFTTAMVIETMETLSSNQGWIFAYVFCNYQQREENRYEILLRSLLRMVLDQTTQLTSEIQFWYANTKEPTISELMGQLRVAMIGDSRTFFIVDALDELETSQRNEFVSLLLELQRDVGVNLYFTSRDLPNIRVLLENTTIVSIRATEHDIGMYLASQMQNLHVPNYIRNDQDLQGEISGTIINAVGDMFLLAELQITQLVQNKSRLRLQKALKAISSGKSTYEEAYRNAMDRIQSQDKLTCELAINAISLLAYAERPLLAAELVHALSVDLGLYEIATLDLPQNEDLRSMCGCLGVYDPDITPRIEDVLAACAGLLVHQPDSDIVQLVHKTTKEYLTSDDGRRKWFPEAQLTIAAICLIYSQAFEDGDDPVNWPFLDYAQKHYGHHIMAQQSLEKREVSTLVQVPHEESASVTGSPLRKAQKLIDQIGLIRMAEELGGMEDLLLLACEKEQFNFARVLLSTQRYCRPSGVSREVGIDPLFFKADCAIDRVMLAAVRNGYVELVGLLLKYGAIPTIQDDDGMSLLAIASNEGHDKVVAFLLDYGYLTMAMMHHEKDGPQRYGPIQPKRGVLSRHFYNSHPFSLVRRVTGNPAFLIKSPICWAAYSGYPLCVHLLWQWIDQKTSAGNHDEEREQILERAVMCAVAGGHAKVLELLLPLTGTDLAFMHDLEYPSLLFLASEWASQYESPEEWKDREAVAELVLSHHTSDLSVCNRHGVNVLMRAAESGLAKIVRQILEEREDQLLSRDNSDRTPLSYALMRGDVDTIHVLLGYKDTQSALEQLDAEGFTPIDYALAYDNGGALAFLVPLLKHGIHRLDLEGCTLLHSLIDKTPLVSFSGERESHHSFASRYLYDLELYEGHKIFDCRKRRNGDEDEDEDEDKYESRCTVRMLRQVLGAASLSLHQIRSSPCICGIGTIFLAISTGNPETVGVLLEFYPDLVNDVFFDGLSPLDLASCIQDTEVRQRMINLILDHNPIVRTYKYISSVDEVLEWEDVQED